MTTDGNKAVVKRFIKEVLSSGNIDLIDELIALDYVNPSMGITNGSGFKTVVSGLNTFVPTRNFEIVDLVAEGDDAGHDFFNSCLSAALRSRRPPDASTC